jgi:hypothetical protein
VGVVGELHLYGAGLALGYLDDEVAIGKRFRLDPLGSGKRTYATGDLAWLDKDGQIYLAGRFDRQVKIRGFRIELAAVEAAARDTGHCSDAYAVAQETMVDKHLVLFVEGCEQPAALAARLREVLPAAMIPRRVQALEALPRLPSGKVEQQHLPVIYQETAHPLQERAHSLDLDDHAGMSVRNAWYAVFNTHPQPGDDFFSSGADSLDVLRLVRHIRAAGGSLTPADVYQTRRYTELVAWVRRNANSPSVASGADTELFVPLSPSQRWFFQQRLPKPNRWNQQHWIKFSSLPDRHRLNSALRRVLSSTPILRARISSTGMKIPATSCENFDVEFWDSTNHKEGTSPESILDALHGSLSPQDGTLVRAAGLLGSDGSGALVLIDHHLVVDDWSWTIIEDRVRTALADSENRKDPTPSKDDAFARFAASLERQRAIGAYTLDMEAWKHILGSGRTSDPGYRPNSLVRKTATLETAARYLVYTWQAPLSAVLLGFIGHALA